jgi:hypothetical protein
MRFLNKPSPPPLHLHSITFLILVFCITSDRDRGPETQLISFPNAFSLPIFSFSSTYNRLSSIIESREWNFSSLSSSWPSRWAKCGFLCQEPCDWLDEPRPNGVIVLNFKPPHHHSDNSIHRYRDMYICVSLARHKGL